MDFPLAKKIGERAAKGFHSTGFERGRSSAIGGGAILLNASEMAVAAKGPRADNYLQGLRDDLWREPDQDMREKLYAKIAIAEGFRSGKLDDAEVRGMISVTGGKIYRQGDGGPEAVAGISLRVAPGEYVPPEDTSREERQALIEANRKRDQRNLGAIDEKGRRHE